MSYLGRPSTGDSPFAIGQKAYFDTSTPQPPSQRNPLPRGQQMVPPQPYGAGPGGVGGPGGDVSGEARRRYEERYRKKKEEEAAAAAAAAGVGGGGGGGGGGQPNQHNHNAHPSHHPPPNQPQFSHPSPGPSTPQFPGSYPTHPSNPPRSPQPPPQQYSPHLSAHPPTHGLSPQTSRSSFDQTRPPYPSNPAGSYHSQQQQQQQPQQQRSQSPYAQQNLSPVLGSGQAPQRWSQQNPTGQASGGGGGPQWSQKAVPSPSQDWRSTSPHQSTSTSPNPHPRPQNPQNSGYQSGSSAGVQSQQGSMGSRMSQNYSQSSHQTQGGGGGGGSSLGHGGDDELRRMFEQFDISHTGQLNSFDLQRLLAKDSLMEDPREDAVKMLMNIFDTDRSGSINFMEFEGLYRYIQDWHAIFQRFDRDSSGSIDRKELHQALLGFGFSLPPEMVRKLEKRFAPPPKLGQQSEGGREGRKGISFDRFLMACVTVKHYTEGFRKLDPNNQGRINVDYNSFMEMVLDAP